MAKLALKKGATDVSVYVFAQDSSVTTGAGLTGLAYNTASLTAYYVRPLGSATAITLATQTVTGAHSDGGFVEVDATNMPGVYRLDLPDAVCATGVPSVVVMLKGAANLTPIPLEIQLTDFDLNSTSNSVGAAASVTGAVGSVTGAVGSVTAGVSLADDAITSAKYDEVTAFPYVEADVFDSNTLLSIPVLGSYDVADVYRLLIQMLTGEQPNTNEDGTGLLIMLSDITTTETLPSLDDKLAAIQADLDNADQYKADVSALATTTHVQEVEDKLDTANVAAAAIKAKTDNLPASPAEAGEYTAAIAAVKSVADGILVDTGTTLDALVKDIPTNAELATALGTADDAVLAALATTDGKVDSILEDTGTTLDTLIKDIPTNTELATALGTADDAVLAAVAATKVVIDDIHDTDLPAVKAETALIVEDTGTTIPALLETIDNFLDTKVAAILEDTGTTLPATLATLAGYTDGIAGDVWSSPIRTLTVPAVAAAATEDGTTLTLYKDADINIEFTGLTIPTGAKKVVFTIKDNLDDADTAAALQATYQLVAPSTETHTLNYINSAVPTGLTNPVTFTVDTDSVEFDMTAAAAYLLPRYERGYLHWDLKLITATTVQILQQGLVQILGTSTRAVA